MSQRNPMNERYSSEQPVGKTRKSAASAKPKAKAASSVYIQPAEKTKEQKKAAEKVRTKERRATQRELDRKYYNPPTKRYKQFRYLWWAVLVVAIVCTAGSFFLRGTVPEAATYVLLGLGYACIIAAFFIEFGPVRKERRRYQAQMESKVTKEMRAAEKRAKAAEKAAAEQKYEEAKAAQAEKSKRGLFGFGKKKEESAADDKAEEAK